jgi:transcriptional regulator with PAS, ATPase and Fis domain
MAREEPTVTALRRDLIEVPAIAVRIEPPNAPVIEVQLGLSPIVVGTSAECDVVIVDPGVSRKHCEIRFGDQGVLLRDLDSKNGTFVGTVGVREIALPIDTAVVVGSTRITLRRAGHARQIPLSAQDYFGEALGTSVAMRELFARLSAAAATHETVLLLGESGTGKELLARGIHDASARRNGPFVVLDCAALAPALIEAELFGHKKGAFTGAAEARDGLFVMARGGTLFIDEVGELPLDLQPRLLRAIESRTVRPLGAQEWEAFDARIVAATNRDLLSRVRAGHFREDLYHRLSVLPALVPPLRARRDDIPLLMDRFLAQLDPPRGLADIPPHALDLFMAHDWPGNVRELRNAVMRVVVYPTLAHTAIDKRGSHGPPDFDKYMRLRWQDARGAVQQDFEMAYIKTRLAEHDGNVAQTAQTMGISRQLLHRLMTRHGIGRE